MSSKVLLAGGSGLIGSYLTRDLVSAGRFVNLLTRNQPSPSVATDYYLWNPERNSIDREALKSTDVIINLAGTGVADKRWTKMRKKQILESRVKSVDLLYKNLAETDHHVKTFVSASAIGIYGYDTGSIIMEENRGKLGDDFLATVVKQWEESIGKIESLGIRTVILRIGIVLTPLGGALKPLTKTIKYGVGSPLGNGGQYMSWIHIHDLCRIFQYVIENVNIRGVYNAVAPTPVTNRDLIKEIARILNRPLIMPPVPAILVRLLLGEMASMVLGGNKVSASKIESSGFEFIFRDVQAALQDLLKE